jgi:hypothetical protein
MPNNTNPAWHGGARQKVSFWSNGSADNKELIFDTQACCPRGLEPSGTRHDRAAWARRILESDRRTHILEDCALQRITPTGRAAGPAAAWSSPGLTGPPTIAGRSLGISEAGISATTAVSQAVTTASASTIELLKAAS